MINIYQATAPIRFTVTAIGFFIAACLSFTLAGYLLASYKFKYIRREFGAQSEIKAKRYLLRMYLIFLSLGFVMQICIFFQSNQTLENLLIIALALNALWITGLFLIQVGWLPYKSSYTD